MNEKEVKNLMVKKSKIFGLRYLEKMNKDPALTGRQKCPSIPIGLTQGVTFYPYSHEIWPGPDTDTG
jgi:hypothetical protein